MYDDPEDDETAPKIIGFVPGTGRGTPYLSGYVGNDFVYIGAEFIQSVKLSD